MLDGLLQGTIHKDMEGLHCLGVEPSRATYTACLHLVVIEPLQMVWSEIFERNMPQGGLQMAPDESFIVIKRGRPDLGLLIVAEPGIQPRPQGQLMWRNKDALALVTEGFAEQSSDLLARFAIEAGALEFPGLWITADGDRSHPAAVFASDNSAFIIAAFLGHRVLSPLS
jgi:hypothetical protein